MIDGLNLAKCEDYVLVRMDKGFDLNMVSDVELSNYRDEVCGVGGKLVIVDDDNQFIYAEE
jgi:hypothetical protein